MSICDDFCVNAGPRGRPNSDITRSTSLTMDITIEFLIIKIPRVSIFSDLCRVVNELLTLATFGSMPGRGPGFYRMASSLIQT